MSANNPLLVVVNAGRGKTPPCSAALFQVRQICRLRKRKHLSAYPEVAVVAAVVPPGFPAEYALADAAGRPRPLMITATKRFVRYIVAFDGNPTPMLLRESDLLASGEPDYDGALFEAEVP